MFAMMSAADDAARCLGSRLATHSDVTVVVRRSLDSLSLEDTHGKATLTLEACCAPTAAWAPNPDYVTKIDLKS